MRQWITGLGLALAMTAFGDGETAPVGVVRTPPQPDRVPARVTLEASLWYSYGTAGFKIRDWFGVISELEYPMEGPLWEVRGELVLHQRPLWNLSVRGRGATQISYEGTSKDSDFDLFGFREKYSESDSKADVLIWDADVVARCRIFPRERHRLFNTAWVGLSLGYGEQTFDYEDENLDAEYDYGANVFQVDGLIAEYRFEYSGVRVGFNALTRPTEKITLLAEAVVIPNLKADNEAYWILRDYPFDQQADGVGLSLDAKIRYQFSTQAHAFMGVRAVSLVADKNGKESGVLNGLAYRDEEIVDDVNAEYVAVELGLGGAF